MKVKLTYTILGLVMILLVVGVNWGCGGQRSTSTTYYWPNWMPDGRIIACKKEMTFTENLWGTGVSDYHYYITAITIGNLNEVIKEEDLFEVDSELAGRGIAEITCSPTGEMIGWIVSGHGLECIKIFDYKGNILYTITPPSTREVIRSFDWSPDASKIAYSTGRLYVTNIDGSNNTQIATSAEAVAWRVGEKIVYDGDWVNAIDPNGGNKKTLIDYSWKPQKKSSDEVIYEGKDGIYLIKIDGTSNTKLFSGYERASLKLSFDNTKIVGGDLDQSRIKGIWVTNLTGEAVGVSKRIR